MCSGPSAMRTGSTSSSAGNTEYPAGSWLSKRGTDGYSPPTSRGWTCDIFYEHRNFGDHFVTEALARPGWTAAGLCAWNFRDRIWGGYTGDLMDFRRTMSPLREELNPRVGAAASGRGG